MTSAPDEPAGPKPEEPPSLEALARRFIDLWQSQVAALAADPETNQLIARLIEAQMGAADALIKASRAAGQANTGERGHDTDQARAETAAAPSHDGERDVAELARRLAACEARLDHMEKRLGKRGVGARAGARKRTP